MEIRYCPVLYIQEIIELDSLPWKDAFWAHYNYNPGIQAFTLPLPDDMPHHPLWERNLAHAIVATSKSHLNYGITVYLENKLPLSH